MGHKRESAYRVEKENQTVFKRFGDKTKTGEGRVRERERET